MFEILMSQNVCIYLMVIMGLLGIAVQGITAGYMRGLVRGADNMGHTRKKALLAMRKRYEDIASLDVEVGDFDSFVDKYIDRIKIGALSVHSCESLIKNVTILVAGTGIFSAVYQYYVVGDSAESLKQMACCAGVYITLRIFRNIWDVSWQTKLLRDGVKNYLCNSLAGRLRKEERRQCSLGDAGVAACAEAACGEDCTDDEKRARDGLDASSYDALLDRVMQSALNGG